MWNMFGVIFIWLVIASEVVMQASKHKGTHEGGGAPAPTNALRFNLVCLILFLEKEQGR